MSRNSCVQIWSQWDELRQAETEGTSVSSVLGVSLVSEANPRLTLLSVSPVAVSPTAASVWPQTRSSATSWTGWDQLSLWGGRRWRRRPWVSVATLLKGYNKNWLLLSPKKLNVTPGRLERTCCLAQAVLRGSAGPVCSLAAPTAANPLPQSTTEERTTPVFHCPEEGSIWRVLVTL